MLFSCPKPSLFGHDPRQNMTCVPEMNLFRARLYIVHRHREGQELSRALTRDSGLYSARRPPVPPDVCQWTVIIETILNQCLTSHCGRLLDTHQLEDCRSNVCELAVLYSLDLFSSVYDDERNIIE